MLRRKTYTSPNRSKKLLIVGSLLAVIAAAGVGAYWYLNKDQPAAKSQPSNNSEPGASRTETSEGSSFTVPDSVPEGAIKNYTLVTENEQYKIRHDEKSNSYIITLYAIINNPSQYDTYRDQLREFKQNALDYLKTEKQVDTSKASITYEPAEATDL